MGTLFPSWREGCDACKMPLFSLFYGRAHSHWGVLRMKCSTPDFASLGFLPVASADRSTMGRSEHGKGGGFIAIFFHFSTRKFSNNEAWELSIGKGEKRIVKLSHLSTECLLSVTTRKGQQNWVKMGKNGKKWVWATEALGENRGVRQRDSLLLLPRINPKTYKAKTSVFKRS